jgi:tetratricopeptide (TPR) repeat protein
LKTSDPAIKLLCDGGIARAYVRLGNDVKVQEKVDYLLSHFKDNPEGVAFCILGIGEDFCAAASVAENNDTREWIYQKAMDVWAKYAASGVKSSFDPRFCYFTADVLRRLKRYDEAIQYYEEVVSRWPSCDEAWQAQLMMADCYQKLKEQNLLSSEEADAKTIEVYKNIVDNYPNTPGAAIVSPQMDTLLQK